MPKIIAVDVWAGGRGACVCFWRDSKGTWYHTPTKASLARLARVMVTLDWRVRPFFAGIVGWCARKPLGVRRLYG